MNVETLIRELKKMPQDAEVYLSTRYCKYSWICDTVEPPEMDLDGDITLTGKGFLGRSNINDDLFEIDGELFHLVKKIK